MFLEMLPGACSEPPLALSLAREETPLNELETHEYATQAIQSKKPRRVKVYHLQGDDWLDHGTGYCMGEVDKGTLKPCFIVRSEIDLEEVLLQSFLEGNIQFQRQQETLIVWTDPAGKDLALSFQETAGCADLCDFIVRVQQESLSPQISLYYVLTAKTDASGTEGPREITELVTGPVNYPPQEPSRTSLQETLDLLTQGCNSLFARYKMLEFLVDTHYCDRLFTLFPKLEDSRDLEALHTLNDIVKVILYYNEPKIVEELVSSEWRVTALAGILEYDRSFPELKACHREYLNDESRLKTVIDIPLPAAQDAQMDIFRKDFVLQYLKNVVLPRSLDELALGLLASMVHANHIEIIEFLLNPHANGDFLQRLFHLYDDGDAPESKKRDAVKLLHQYVLVAKNNLSNQLADFLSALVKGGLLKMVTYALDNEDSALRVAGIEILATVIDQDVVLVNLVSNENKEVDELEGVDSMGADLKKADFADDEHTHEKLEQIKLNLMNDMSLPLLLGKLLLSDPDPALKIQAYEAIKNLLCSTVFDCDLSNRSENGVTDGDDAHRAYVKKYFEAFYEQVAPTLFRTFIDLASGTEEVKNAAEQWLQKDPVLFQHLCDLISFCCHEHEASICRPFFTKSRALDGIVTILALRVNVTLKLGVLRCFKGLILLDDYAFCCHMVEHDLFAPYFAYFTTVAARNSLPNSLCLDLLEIIVRRSSTENFACLAMHISQNYRLFLETKISYVSTGKNLIMAAKQFRDRVKDSTVTSVDANDDYLNDPHPSSPIMRDGNGYHSSETVNGTLKLENGFNGSRIGEENAKKKRGSYGENSSDKRLCLTDREKILTYQDMNAVEEEKNSHNMAIQP